MADTTHRGYTAAIANALTTELNAIAIGGITGASAAIDNTTALDLFYDFTLSLAAQGTARVAGAYVAVYIVQAVDGTNYDAVLESTAEQVAFFSLDATVTARQLTRRDIPVPPGLFKFFAKNGTGQILAATGNTLKYRAHSVKTL